MAEVRAEDLQGEPVPARLLPLHGGAALPGEEAGAAVRGGHVGPDHHVRLRAQPPAPAGGDGHGVHDLRGGGHAHLWLHHLRRLGLARPRPPIPLAGCRRRASRPHHHGLHRRVLPHHHARPHLPRRAALPRTLLLALWRRRSSSSGVRVQGGPRGVEQRVLGVRRRPPVLRHQDLVGVGAPVWWKPGRAIETGTAVRRVVPAESLPGRRPWRGGARSHGHAREGDHVGSELPVGAGGGDHVRHGARWSCCYSEVIRIGGACSIRSCRRSTGKGRLPFLTPHTHRHAWIGGSCVINNSIMVNFSLFIGVLVIGRLGKWE
jgi:hypothetical protein